MHPETTATEQVGVEIRAGRPWFAVCCASCLLVLIFIGAVIGYLVTQDALPKGTDIPFIRRLLNTKY